ncbi:MAG: S1C family serine protease [Candidatus Obscuribacterales bacterium]
MIYDKSLRRTAMWTSLTAAACTQLQLAACAHNSEQRVDRTTPLVPQTAKLDTARTVENRLFGSAQKIDAETEISGSAQTTTDQHHTQMFQLAAEKLTAGEELNAEEYRALGVGITGYEVYSKFFKNQGVVEAVYEDSPADRAGIKVGDKVTNLDISQTVEDKARANPTQPLWSVAFKRVGVPVELTVVRHGKEIPMTLITYNIEDIKDPEIRHMFEQMISNLGFPKEGEFSATSMKELTGATDP